MNTILRQYLGVVAVAGCLIGAFGACKKTFNTEPPTSLVPADLSGAGASQTVLNGIYRLLRNASTGFEDDRFGIPALMIANELLGGDMGMSRPEPLFRNDYQYFQAINAQSGRSGYIWSFFYRILRNVNLILARQDAPPAQRGQALSLRAFAYFNLVNYYTAKPYQEVRDNLCVPLYLTPDQTPKPPEKTGVIYAQIVQDLEEAVGLLQGFSAPRKSVIDQSVAYGLLARTYLFMEEWQKAADAADKALSGGKGAHPFNGSDLMSQTEFQSGFNSVANSECMWGLPTNAAQNTREESFFSHMDLFVKGYAGNRSIFKFMSRELYNKMAEEDVRKSLIAKPLNAGSLLVTKGDLAPMKFRDPAVPFSLAQKYNAATAVAQRTALQKSVTNAWLGETIIMRKAEMYLIYAEACCKSSQNNKMQTALKALRTKRGITSSDNLNIDSVYLERRKELFGEGFRFFDLKRLKLPADRTKGGHIPSIVVRTYISANSDSMRFYIPQGEINNNPNIN